MNTDKRRTIFGKQGVELSGAKEAFQVLRKGAQEAIAEGDRLGVDMRQRVVSLRDEAGEVMFEGTLGEAAALQIDGKVVLPREPSSG